MSDRSTEDDDPLLEVSDGPARDWNQCGRFIAAAARVTGAVVVIGIVVAIVAVASTPASALRGNNGSAQFAAIGEDGEDLLEQKWWTAGNVVTIRPKLKLTKCVHEKSGAALIADCEDAGSSPQQFLVDKDNTIRLASKTDLCLHPVDLKPEASLKFDQCGDLTDEQKQWTIWHDTLRLRKKALFCITTGESYSKLQITGCPLMGGEGFTLPEFWLPPLSTAEYQAQSNFRVCDDNKPHECPLLGDSVCKGMEAESCVPPDYRVHVLVPGLGETDRAEVVKGNIAWLKGQGVHFTCSIYVYKSETEFPLDADEYQPCELIRHPGYMADHIAALKPDEWAAGHPDTKLILWLDSVVPMPDVNLTQMMDTMSQNCLQVLSLSDNKASVHRFHPVMAQNYSNPVGRFTDFGELNWNMFDRDAFLCWQHISDPKLNKFGLGVDILFRSICGVNRMGIMDSMSQKKAEGGSYNLVGASGAATTWVSEQQKTHPDLQFAHRLTLGLLKPAASRVCSAKT